MCKNSSHQRCITVNYVRIADKLNHRHRDVFIQQQNVACRIILLCCSSSSYGRIAKIFFVSSSFFSTNRNERLIGGGALFGCGNVLIYKNRLLTWRIIQQSKLLHRSSFLVSISFLIRSLHKICMEKTHTFVYDLTELWSTGWYIIPYAL